MRINIDRPARPISIKSNKQVAKRRTVDKLLTNLREEVPGISTTTVFLNNGNPKTQIFIELKRQHSMTIDRFNTTVQTIKQWCRRNFTVQQVRFNISIYRNGHCEGLRPSSEFVLE